MKIPRKSYFLFFLLFYSPYSFLGPPFFFLTPLPVLSRLFPFDFYSFPMRFLCVSYDLSYELTEEGDLEVGHEGPGVDGDPVQFPRGRRAVRSARSRSVRRPFRGGAARAKGVGGERGQRSEHSDHRRHTGHFFLFSSFFFLLFSSALFLFFFLWKSPKRLKRGRE